MNTQIPVPADLKARIEHEARARGMSLADFVRESLEQAISHSRADDPLFADTAVHRDHGPADMAAKHDDYLYGDER
jgi:predicted DNA-binding protein